MALLFVAKLREESEITKKPKQATLYMPRSSYVILLKKNYDTKGGVANAKPITENTLFYGDNLASLREYIHTQSVDLLSLALPSCIGTAAGDLTAATLGLGYFSSGVLFAVLFAVPALAYRLFGLNEVVAFWFAYIMTRPLGASFADWFGKPSLGGLGLGDTKVALVLTILIIGFVGYLTVTRKDMKGEQRW